VSSFSGLARLAQFLSGYIWLSHVISVYGKLGQLRQIRWGYIRLCLVCSSKIMFGHFG